MLRLALASVALAVSACVTTTTIAPRDLAAVAGLAPGERARVQTESGEREVRGDQRVTVRARAEEGASFDLQLSELRADGREALLVPPYEGPGTRLALADLADTPLAVPSPWRTVGLAGLIVLGAGTVLVVSSLIFVATQIHSEPLLGADRQLLR